MGACDFSARATGKDAKEAFRTAVDEARYEYGHGGYTGSIAEKSSFILVERPKGKKLKTFLEEVYKSERFDDKWGPAGCVDITLAEKKRYKERGMKWPRGQKCFEFFGVASE